MPAAQNNSYASTRFLVKIDGHAITSYVKSVDGGLYKVESAPEPTGPYHIPVRHISTRSIEPINMEIGMSGTGWVMGILEKVINNREHSRFDGEILLGDANLKTRYRQEFKRALVTEIVLPGLDANSKESAFIKLKLQPETIDFKNENGAKIQAESETKQKMFNANSFRLNLEVNNKKINCEQVTKIEAITIKMNAKPLQAGKFHLPQYIPTKLDVSKISVTLPLDCAGDFIQWYRDTVTTEAGRKDGAPYEATGSIEYLDQKRAKTVYEVELMGVAPESLTIGKAETSGSSFRSVKVDLYCTQLKVSKSGLG